MNRNQTESKPASVEETREEGLGETPCSAALYYFRPRSYGQEFFVCAHSEEEAKEFLRAATTEGDDEWLQETQRTAAEADGEWTLEVFKIGEVCRSEIC